MHGSCHDISVILCFLGKQKYKLFPGKSANIISVIFSVLTLISHGGFNCQSRSANVREFL
jgi:hypothetical protein